MSSEKQKILTNTVRRLLRRGANRTLAKLVEKTHEADLADLFVHLDQAERREVFDHIKEVARKAEVLSELEPTLVAEFIEEIKDEAVVDIFHQMSSDDLADIFEVLPPERAKHLLDLMKEEESNEVGELMRWDNRTAGGIMVPEFFALSEEVTAREAVEALQREYVEMAFYLYVVNDHGQLVGVISLRQLVTIGPETKLRDIMTTDVLSVSPETDQEDVARIVARYNLLALPVVDESNKLLGIVTVDDVIDVLQEEAEEDLLRMAGTGESATYNFSVLEAIRGRLPWLFASLLAGVGTFLVMIKFVDVMSRFVVLSSLVPLVLSLSGTVGSQSSVIVIRDLTAGHVDLSRFGRILYQELLITGILGFLYGLIAGAIIWGGAWALGIPMAQELSITVLAAITTTMILGALLGAIFPLLISRLNLDPAGLSGPTVSISLALLTVIIYLSLASFLL